MRGEWDILSGARLRGIARAERIDLLHAHNSRAHALALPVARELGLPLVVSRRVETRPSHFSFTRRKYLAREVHFVAVSAAIADGLLAMGVPANRVQVIPDGVDLSRFGAARTDATRAGLGCASEDVLFGNVAALSPEKDQATLLRAFARVEHQEPRARLAIVGSGPLERVLRRLAESLGLRRVVFTGWRDDVPALLAAFDAFVLSSRREGLGSAIVEALVSGRPVVATRVGGIPELIQPEVNGVLVEPADVDALASAMLGIVADSDRRCRMGAAAQQNARARFGSERMVDAHVALYRRLLGRAADRGDVRPAAEAHGTLAK
jgi:glycosyltransferase involved in cell wall biosynthesis